MAAVNITEYDIPSTPLLARPGNGRGNIDPKLVFAVMGQLKTDFPLTDFVSKRFKNAKASSGSGLC